MPVVWIGSLRLPRSAGSRRRPRARAPPRPAIPSPPWTSSRAPWRLASSSTHGGRSSRARLPRRAAAASWRAASSGWRPWAWPAGRGRARAARATAPRARSTNHVIMPKAKVALLRTSPATVLRDYHRLMNLARLPGRHRAGRRHRAQGQHLLALLLSRQLDDAVAARGRHPRDEAGRLRPGPDPRLPQPHRRHRRAPRRAREQADQRRRGARPAQRPPLRGRGVDRDPRRRRRSDEEVPLPQRGLPEGLHDPAALHRREHHPPADGEDAHLHDDDRRDEERLRRPAERAPPLDAPGHPRDARRPADDPEEDPPRRLRRDGRHVRRRRPRAALHDAAREERDPRVRRSGRDRRRRREADGLRPHVDQVHPPRARRGPRLRRPARHRDRRRRVGRPRRTGTSTARSRR